MVEAVSSFSAWARSCLRMWHGHLAHLLPITSYLLPITYYILLTTSVLPLFRYSLFTPSGFLLKFGHVRCASNFFPGGIRGGGVRVDGLRVVRVADASRRQPLPAAAF